MRKLKIIVVNLSILFLFAFLTYFFVYAIKSLNSLCTMLSHYKDMLSRKLSNPESVGNTIEDLQSWIFECQSGIANCSIRIILFLLAFAACIFLFVYCNPRLFRRSTWTNLSAEWAKNKEERAAARVAKAEENKQKRIEELQAELDELNGDKKE